MSAIRSGLKRGTRFGSYLAAVAGVPALAGAQSLPASPASSTKKPGKEETAPKKDDSGLIITAAIRARYETVDGRPRPGFATSEDAFLLRTGVAVEYGPGPLAIGAEVVDSRPMASGAEHRSTMAM